MNPSSAGTRRNIRHINDEVPDLSIEDVCRPKSKHPSSLIFITIDETKPTTAEIRRR